MEIKKLTKDDYDLATKEIILAFQVPPWNENWTYEQAYTRIEEIMDSRVARGYVMYQDGIVVSTLIGRIMTYLDYKELWMDDFSVHPDYQGQGIGKRMLNHVKEEMKKENIRYLILNTTRGYDCVEFYKRNGFEKIESMITMCCPIEVNIED